eukprot:3032648-Prymnesium_polylepis.1
MPHECRPRCLQGTRATHRVYTVSPRPRAPPTPDTPRRRLAARTFARPAVSAPRVCSVPTP